MFSCIAATEPILISAFTRANSTGLGFATAIVFKPKINAAAVKDFIGIASLLYATGNHRNRASFRARLSYWRDCYRPLVPHARRAWSTMMAATMAAYLHIIIDGAIAALGLAQRNSSP